MNEKEKQLFKALCRFRDPISDTALTEFATPAVLGHLFFNRMSGIAYGTLRCNGLLGKVNREFRSSLSAAWEQNVQKNESFRKCVAFLSGLLASSDCKVALLKGALLCARYPDGYRTSNDVDLLVSPSDVTKIGHLLSSAGFRQGNVRNRAFIPATREQIIESRMMRGETVPYVLEVNLPFMKFLEVDVNFSLDYKNGSETALTKMLSAACRKDENGISVPTLDDKDFFLHLCAHLYKEATTLPWIEMHRDMTLYKYCDLYLLLSEMTDPQLRQIFERAGELGMEKVCAYAILETMGLFDMDHPFARHIAGGALGDDPDFCRKVVSPKDKKLLMYRTADVTERFFLEAREKDLAEVSGNEST